MGRRNSEPSIDEKLRHASERLHIFDAIAAALDRLHDLSDAIAQSADADAAKRAVRDRFGFDELQATAVMDAQFVRLNAGTRTQIGEERQNLKRVVRELRDELAGGEAAE